MLFNSYGFIFVFLPIAFAGMFWLGRYSPRLAAFWLAVASIAFYALWDIRYVPLLLGSVAINYGAGYWISFEHTRARPARATLVLTGAIVVDLILLGSFKYSNFFATSINQALGSRLPALDVILPLGISFFTFTQIAFLVDVHRGISRELNGVHYLLFVTYFPHLIAGPVLHHKQMMPQFSLPATYRIKAEHVSVGLTMFVLGLAKKVILADGFAEYAVPIFDAVDAGRPMMFAEAWIGVLAYALQIYFDFSGYSDMAIGLSLLFNIRLPLNFDSPYKATSIIDFWRRWHMTLSAFLRDYLYVSLGGNRKGPVRRYVNLMATMLLGGLWHGAGWTFVIWGGLHGFYLIVNHGWREVKSLLGVRGGGRVSALGAGALTFFAVAFAWVFFRAGSIASAVSLLRAMIGLEGFSLPEQLGFGRVAALVASYPQSHIVFKGLTPVTNTDAYAALAQILVGLALVWLVPNVRQLLIAYGPAWEDMVGVKTPTADSSVYLLRHLRWSPSISAALAVGFLFALSLLYMAANRISQFLYFQF